MRLLPSLFLFLGLSAANLDAGSIQYQVAGLGGSSFRYSYLFSGFALQANHEIEIHFDPALYSDLTNGAAGSDFHLVVNQPDNPSGTFGDYSILALIDNPSFAGQFSVDFVFLTAGQPGAQPFFINQFTPGRLFDHTIETGWTAPEPTGWSLTAVGLLGGFAIWAVRRKTKLTAHD